MRWPYGAFLLAIISIALCSNAAAESGNHSQKLIDGIEYQKITVKNRDSARSSPAAMIHIFHIDPLKFKLQVVTAKSIGSQSSDAQTYAERSKALLAINGGFFTPEYASLGLIAQNGREINPMKQTSWWHVFQVRNKKASVIAKNDYKLTGDIEMAIEAGPRLLTDGTIPEGLKPSSSDRTALGITKDGKIVIVVTENYSLSMADLAKRLRSTGCINALNLDGGSSTQLYTKIGKFELRRPGFNSVANAIVVLPRNTATQ